MSVSPLAVGTHEGVSSCPMRSSPISVQVNLDTTLAPAPVQRQQETEATLEASDEETKSEETGDGENAVG